VHSAVRELTRTIYDSAFKFCGNSILIRDDKTSELTQNEWFDNKCIKARAEFHYARNIFSRHSNEANRHLYVSSRGKRNLATQKEKDYNFVILLKRIPRNFGRRSNQNPDQSA